MTTKAEIDMSEAAVQRRLEELRALYKLCMSLKTAGKAADKSSGR
jgi:hypothetical protein